MAEEKSSKNGVYDVRCKGVLEVEGVRFAGIINENGKMLAGGFKHGIAPFEKDEGKFKQFLKRVIEISLWTEEDKALGDLNYIVSRRDKVVLISFPFPASKNILLVSAEPHTDIDDLAKKVTDVFDDSSLTAEIG